MNGSFCEVTQLEPVCQKCRTVAHSCRCQDPKFSVAKTLAIHLAEYNEKIARAVEDSCPLGEPPECSCHAHRQAHLVRSVKP